VESTITTDIIRYDHPGGTTRIRSHVLHPREDITIIALLTTPQANVMSVIEDHLLEHISSTEWKPGDEDADFSYVTEKFNHFLSNLALEDLATVGAIFAIERDAHLMVSSIGDAEIILEEDHAHPSNIHEDTRWHHHFELISSGDIPTEGSVFIASRSLENLVGDTFYTDCGGLESEVFIGTAREVLTRDVADTTHLIRIRHTCLEQRLSHRQNRSDREGSRVFRIVRDGWDRGFSVLRHHPRLRRMFDEAGDFFEKKNSYFLWAFLVIGVIIFFGLVSYLMNTLFSVSTRETKDARNQIIEATNLVESSQKLTTNPVAFNTTIDQAQTILLELETKQLYLKTVQELRYKIEALKKELYDVQTVKLEDGNSLVPFDAAELWPIGIYEKDKKLNIIGKRGVIQEYAVWDTNFQIKQYPSSEQAKDYAILEDGNFYLLTDSNRVLASRKWGDISYINVTGQDKWEAADGISTFNSNIYLWNKNEWQVYKHRPWINGFAEKTALLPEATPGIRDVGIDGGFYIIRNDQKITRFLSSSNTQTGILINQIPGEYTVWKDNVLTRIILSNNLNYIYILDGNRVWIFSPDAKRFQDIKSWTYIAQVEIISAEKIMDISVPRDGLVYILTEKWVYDINFEFVENNIIVR
jgi:hypothetical protein